MSLVNRVTLGTDSFAASANTYVGQVIPKCRGDIHFGARSARPNPVWILRVEKYDVAGCGGGRGSGG